MPTTSPSKAPMSPGPLAVGARLGVLIGLFEGIGVARWDVWMDDLSPERLLGGLGWLAVIVMINALFWSALLGLCRGSRRIAAPLFVAGVLLARWWVGDRFDPMTAIALPVALALAWRGAPRLDGLLAIALALPGVWGRVPNYTVSAADAALFWAPAAALVIALGLSKVRPAWLAALGVPALLAVGGGERAAAPVPDGPNVLFILVDTLRPDHVSPFGDRAETPFIAELASQGARFDDAVTVIPKTTQSVTAIQTGLYPIHNKVRRLNSFVPEAQRPMAERLRERGYATAAFVHNGWVMRGRGFEQGYEQFWSWFELERPYGPLRYAGPITLLDGLTLQRSGSFDGNTYAEVTVDRTIQWLEDVDRPFYAYIHTFDPHWPYRPQGEDGECLVNNIREAGLDRGEMIFQNDLPEAENARARELYALEVEHNLSELGRLVRWLDESGLGEDTVVVFTADHGHSLGEHDYHYHHGEFLYDASLRVPLVIRSPGEIAPGTQVSHQVRSIDIAPTVLGLLGVPADGMDGVDLLRETPGPAFLETDTSHFSANTRRYVKGVKGKVRGIRTSDWKLIYTPRPEIGLWELYDLRADPEERRDLVAAGEADPEILLGLMAELRDAMLPRELRALEAIGNRFDALPRAWTGEAPVGGAMEAAAPEDLELLRSLGYVE